MTVRLSAVAQKMRRISTPVVDARRVARAITVDDLVSRSIRPGVAVRVNSCARPGKVAFSQLAEAGCPLHSGWVGHLPITAWPHRAIYPTRVTSLHAALFEGMGRGRCAGSIDRGGISWYTLASRVTVQPFLWTSKW